MRVLRNVLLGTLFLALPRYVFGAVPTVPNTVSSPCIISSLPCPGGGAVGFATYVETYLFNGAQIVFLTAAMLMFAYYGIRLIFESSEESTISEVKSAYTYGIAGAAIVSLAVLIVRTVGQSDAILGVGDNTGNLVNVSAVANVLGTIEFYIRIMVGTSVSVLVVYQGFRLIALQGSDSELDAQKKRFLHALIGVSVILLANTVISAFIIPYGGGTGNSGVLADEMIGIANFLLVIIGGLAVLSFIAAGVFLVVSTDEGLKDRAKKTIFTTVVTLIVVLSTYAIINYVFALGA